jgi:hypothetical protein
MRIAPLAKFQQFGIVARLALRSAAPVAAVVAAMAGSAPGHAQSRLDARYSVTLAGLPIGKGAWVIDLAEDQFTAAASGGTSGLLNVFARGHGTSASRGFMVSGSPVATSFAASITAETRTEEIRMTLGSGDVKSFVVTPTPKPDPNRIPLTEAHQRGATDPMTASLVRAPGNGDPLNPQACLRKSSVFDGRLRYDLHYAFKRMDRVQAEKGYQGPVVVCSVQFAPLAGHDPERSAIQYLMKLKGMEVWLAPIGTTRVLVPFRVSIPTPIGTGVLQATQFVTVMTARGTTARSRAD